MTHPVLTPPRFSRARGASAARGLTGPLRVLTAVLGIFATTVLPAPLAGCQATRPAGVEPFARDRLRVLARCLDSTRLAQTSAADALIASLDRTSPARVQGMPPEVAYELGRREMLRLDARVHEAESRLRTAEARGRDLLDEWDGELGRYEDPDLRRAAEQNYEAVRARYRATIKSLKTAQESLTPVHVQLSDQVLAIKHQRDKSEVGLVERSAEGEARAQGVRQAMRDKVQAASAAVDEFTASISRTQKPRERP